MTTAASPGQLKHLSISRRAYKYRLVRATILFLYERIPSFLTLIREMTFTHNISVCSGSPIISLHFCILGDLVQII